MRLGAAIRCRGLALDRSGRRVLGPLDLDVGAGQLWGVVGPNGAGKTTLLRLLAGLDRASTGELEVGGRRLSPGRPRSDRPARAAVGCLLQQHAFAPDLPFSVAEVVGFGRAARAGLLDRPTAEDRRAVEEALAALGLGELRGRLYRELSGGERQKVQLARVLAQDPLLWLLDEPAAGLDLDWQERLTALVGELHRRTGGTVLMVTHRVEHLPASTGGVLLLRAGAAIAAGPPEEVLTAPTLERLYGCPMTVTVEAGRYGARARRAEGEAT
jgi:ABC-type cobalamin/Fe3+-siderophores transport system ATPase subunit